MAKLGAGKRKMQAVRKKQSKKASKTMNASLKCICDLFSIFLLPFKPKKKRRKRRRR